MLEEGNSGCEKIDELLEAETNVIKKHLADHKWFNHIPDENSGLFDFIQKYGWIMREMYCGYSCPSRFECNLAKEFLPKEKSK